MKKLLFPAGALLVALAAWWGGSSLSPTPQGEPVASASALSPPPTALAALRLARERQASAAALRANAGLAADTGLADGGLAPRLLRISGLVEQDGLPSAATVHVGAATVTTTDGTFSWEGTTAGALSVWAERGPLRSGPWVAPPSEDHSHWVRLLLVEPSRVVGQVVDSEHHPVPKAKVALDGVPGESPLTDDHGRFRFERVPPGGWELTAEATGFATSVRPVRVEAGRENELEVTLDRFAVVQGRVVDVRGAPAAGALVRLQGFATGKADTTTAADGSFVFDRARQPAYILSAERSGELSRPTFVRAADRNIVLVLGPAASLEVTVTRGGRPLEGVELWLTAAGLQTPFNPPLTTTDGSGLARFPSVAAATYRLNAEPRGGAARPAGELIVKPGRNVFPLELPATSRRVELRVVDSLEHLGVPQARVSLAGHAQVADDDGRVAFEDAEEDGVLEASAEATGFSRGQATLDEKATQATIELHPRRMLRGTAVDSAHRPLASVRIDSVWVSTRQGRFETTVDGSAALTQVGFGNEDGLHQIRELPAGDADVDLGEVVLEEGSAMALSVTLTDGRPAAYATVYAVTRAELPNGWRKRGPDLSVDGAGRLRHPVTPGSYCLLAALGDHAPNDVSGCPIVVQQGQVVPVSLRLRQAAWVIGTVKRRGQAWPGAVVGLVDANLVVVTDENGGFRLGPLSPGTDKLMLLDLVAGGPSAQLTEFTVKEGETKRVDLGGESSASVVLRWAEPVAGQEAVSLFPGRHDRASAKADLRRGVSNLRLQGVAATAVEARFDAIPEGEWTAFLSTREGPVREVQLVVTGESDLEVAFPLPPAAPK